VLKPQVDEGYDLVLENDGIVRHVQLKSSYRGSSTPCIQVNSIVAGKPTGCVITKLASMEEVVDKLFGVGVSRRKHGWATTSASCGSVRGTTATPATAGSLGL